MPLQSCHPVPSQDRLDPIDWATYEPYFWGNVQRHMQRTAILFGTLVQLQRNADAGPAGSKTAAAPATAATDSNPLNLMPVAPRFQYLPISAPSVGGPSASGLTASNSSKQLAGVASGASLLAGIASGAGIGGASPLSVGWGGDMAGQYSFADLGTRATGRTVDGGSGGAAVGPGGIGFEAATAGMAAGASALSAFQARLQAGLGTMLGDKAADLTAMAQQRLGDNIADFTALGSGLLGSTGLFAKAK